MRGLNSFRLFVIATVAIAAYLWYNDEIPSHSAISRRTRQVDSTLGKGYCENVLNSIVVTYDEGPSTTYTDILLNNLATTTGKVVFHVNPTWLSSNQALQLKIKRAYSYGHQIGLRWRTTLDSSLNSMSVTDFMQNLVDDANFIGQILGMSTVPRFVRFPQDQLTTAQMTAAANAGFISTFWAIDSADYSPNATVSSVVAAYTSKMDNVTTPQFRSSMIAINRDLYQVAADAAVPVLSAISSYRYSLITLDTCFNQSAYFTPTTTVTPRDVSTATGTAATATATATSTATANSDENTSSGISNLAAMSTTFMAVAVALGCAIVMA